MPSLRTTSQLATLSESERSRTRQILCILRESLCIRSEDFVSVLIAQETHDPFRVLAATILSQSCTDIAALRAYRNLDERIGVDPVKLGQAESRAIARAISVAGLHHQKAKALKRLGHVVNSKPAGTLESIIQEPVEEARLKLQELPKVGPKTSDVLLSIWKRPTISVDTHVDRVSKRLGFATRKAKYEEVRKALMNAFDEGNYLAIPLLFMAHGRKFCKARRPLCHTCPIEHLCSYSHKTK